MQCRERVRVWTCLADLKGIYHQALVSEVTGEGQGNDDEIKQFFMVDNARMLHLVLQMLSSLENCRLYPDKHRPPLITT